MSTGPETTTDSSQTTKQNSTSKTKSQAELEAEQLVQAQSLGLTGTQNVGQTSTQQVGQQATSEVGQQSSLNTGQTSNIGTQATQNTGQQSSENIGQTSNIGQAATQQNVAGTGTQASTNLGTTAGHTETQGLAAAQPMLQNILDTAQNLGVNVGINPTETAALQGITGAAETAAGFAPQITDLANAQFAGGGYGAGQGEVNNAYDAAKAAYSRVLNGDMTGENNPFLQTLLGTIQDRIRNNVGGAFANAGRSFSGAHANALAQGMSQGLADPLFQNYWKERDAQMGAAQGLQNSALSRSGELDRITGQQLGARAAAPETLKGLYDPYNTALSAGAYEAQQPLSRLGMLASPVVSIAGTGGATDTTGTQAQTGLVNTANNQATTGLTNTSDFGTSQNLGMLNTSNQGLTNTSDFGTSVNTGLLNTASQGLTNTATAGLTNTADAGLTASAQAANQLTNSMQEQEAKSKTKAKGTATTTGTSTSSTTSDPFQIGVGLLTGVGGLLG